MAAKKAKNYKKKGKQVVAETINKPEESLGIFSKFSKMETFTFCVGFLLSIFAVFMVVSFVSYLFTGDVDNSLLDPASISSEEKVKFMNVCGAAGARVSYFFLNDLFGLASFLIPPYLIIVGMKLMRIFNFTLLRKFILFGVAIIWLSVFFGYISEFEFMKDSFIKIGGNHGINVVNSLVPVIGEPGLLLVLVIVAVGYLIYLSAKTIEIIRNILRLNFIKKMKAEELKRLLEKGAGINNDDDDNESTDEENGDNENKYVDEDNQQVENIPVKDSKPTTIELFGRPEDRVDISAIIYEGDGNKADGDMQTGDDSNEEQDESFVDAVAQGKEENEYEPNDVTAPTELTIEKKDTEVGDGVIERGSIDTPYDPRLDLEHYKFPTIGLLNKSNDSGSPQVDMEEQIANKEKIIHVLKSFGVEIRSIKATIGPTITLYEIVPAEGTKISKIRNLEDDIALSLAAVGIRIIAPIPGKGTIGIEVPNKKPCIVSMESIINSRAYQESKMELPCALGKTISNEVFMFDLAKAPHLLVAGATGQGKSVGLNAIVTSLLYKKHPAELKIVMVDPKKVEFSIYSPIENHFLARLEEEDDCIITDVQKVVKTLNSLCQLMDSRYDMLKKASVRNIKEYNEKFKSRKLNPEAGHEFMPYIVVIVDEFGDLIMTAGKEVELPICRIAQLARAVGIHMIIATQRPQASIISGAIKTNFPTRIAFKVSSMIDSRVILDRPGANQLIGKGDLLYLQGAEPVRVQCAFVDTPEVGDICHHIACQQSYLHPMYLPEVAEPEGESSGGMSTVDRGHLDPMFSDVASFVVSNQSGSTSMIQRRYAIGYNRAGKIMDQLEKMGVVGPQVGSKPREVLIKDPVTLEGLLNTLG